MPQSIEPGGIPGSDEKVMIAFYAARPGWARASLALTQCAGESMGLRSATGRSRRMLLIQMGTLAHKGRVGAPGFNEINS